MKLKKIASLMLAGVMAVSMLAGCSNGTKPDDGEKDPVVDSSLTGKVIAALDEDTTKTVDFTSSSALDSAVTKLIQKKGTDAFNTGNIIASELNAINDEISSSSAFKWYNTNNKSNADEAGKEAKVTVVIDTSASKIPAGANEEYAVKQIAAAMDKAVEGLKLEDDSFTYKLDNDNDGEEEEFWFNYSYTGNVCVTEVTNAETGAVHYVAVFTVVRTAAQQNK